MYLLLKFNQQAISGHGLQVPWQVKENSSEVSFIFDGQVLTTCVYICIWVL